MIENRGRVGSILSSALVIDAVNATASIRAGCGGSVEGINEKAKKVPSLSVRYS